MEIPELDFRPATPKAYQPGIGLVGCGGIAAEHLAAYRRAGFRLLALCDLRVDLAKQRAAEFFPQATIYTDYRELLDRSDIQVVDVATHPEQRFAVLRDCLMAGKHVLSQKPFVTDISQGEQLVKLAAKQSVQLAVNQNGRWAPHFRFMQQAVQAGLVGQVFAAHLACHWDHSWIKGTEFEKIRHLILYDYAIHWFDIVRYLMLGRSPEAVFASTARAPQQMVAPNLLAQALLMFDDAQASLIFDADVRQGQLDQTYIVGTQGTLRSFGPSIQSQQVELTTRSGTWRPKLQGSWFPDGFQGTMGELLCAVEENRPTSISAADNLKSLELCFAALASADSGQSVSPGSIRILPT